ncbi:hypothetical protein [Jiangella mangrovi]|uniref:Uncharacterized protein n=1 Tax=Jiangella mangrovi TaxID=1524084 RepID=A0A7W9LNV7_9ACTN|nr:hypothetical protein [Jiangella mangrovi]MBB5790738.1 hypothetical protein [Jiangella mangrovi]
MLRDGRKAGPRSLLARLTLIRAHTRILGETLRDLRPLIVALTLLGAGLVLDADDALRHLVALLT